LKHLLIGGRDFACPFIDLFRPLTPDEKSALEFSIVKRKKILKPVYWYKDEREGPSIIDGHHKARIGEANGIEPDLVCFGNLTRKQAREAAYDLNVPGRHLTLAELIEAKQAARLERIPRVTGLKENGDSNRAIAAKVGITETQVRRDLDAAAASGAPYVAPETIKGIDGKEYTPPEKPPKCPGRRVTVVERIAHHVDGLSRNVKRFAAASPSNKSVLAMLARTLCIPISEDGLGSPQLDSWKILARQLAGR
jgi:hypothetical protein